MVSQGLHVQPRRARGATIELRPGLTVVGLEPPIKELIWHGPLDGVRLVTAKGLPTPDPAAREALVAAAASVHAQCGQDRDRAAHARDQAARALSAAKLAFEQSQGDLGRALERVHRGEAGVAEGSDAHQSARASLARAQESCEVAMTHAAAVASARVNFDAALRSGAKPLRVPSHEADQVSPPLDGLRALGISSTGALEATSAWLEALRDGTAPVEPRAQELIDRADELERRQLAIDSGRTPADAAVDDARSCHAGLAAFVRELETHVNAGSLRNDVRLKIETLHSIRSELENAPSRRAAAELATVSRQEDETLSSLGFDSYLEFTIAMSTGRAGQHVEGRLRAARKELARAADALSSAVDAAESQVQRLVNDRAELERAICAYLGWTPPPPASAALHRRFAVPASAELLAGELDTHARLTAERANRSREDLSREWRQLHEAQRGVAAAEAELADATRVAHDAASAAESARAELDIAEEHHHLAAGLLATADAALADAARRNDDAIRARYVSDDLVTIRCALAEIVSGSETTHHKDQTSSSDNAADADVSVVVFFDALELFDSADVVELCAAVLETADTPVVYLTSDPELLQWAERNGTTRCVDLRPRTRFARPRSYQGRRPPGIALEAPRARGHSRSSTEAR